MIGTESGARAGFLFPAAAHAREDAQMIDRPIHRSSEDPSDYLGERWDEQIIQVKGKQSFKAFEDESGGTL